MSDPNDFFTRSIVGESLRLDIGKPSRIPSLAEGANLAHTTAQARTQATSAGSRPAFAAHQTGIVPQAILTEPGHHNKKPHHSIYTTESSIAASTLSNTNQPVRAGHKAQGSASDISRASHEPAMQAYAPYLSDAASDDTNLVSSPGFMISIYALIIVTLGLALYVLGRGVLF